MNYTNLFKIALRAIFANKMRSFLTALGIIIGVASVIAMLAIGQGSKKSIQANIAEMGSNMIMINPGQDMRGGVRQDASSMETLKLNDYQTLKDECKYISAISPVVNSSGPISAHLGALAENIAIKPMTTRKITATKSGLSDCIFWELILV